MAVVSFHSLFQRPLVVGRYSHSLCKIFDIRCRSEIMSRPLELENLSDFPPRFHLGFFMFAKDFATVIMRGFGQCKFYIYPFFSSTWKGMEDDDFTKKQ